MFSKMNKKKMEFQSSDEDVQVVDETEYLKRTSKLRGGAGTHTVNLSSGDDSVKVVEEKRNLRFDDGEDEGEDADSGFQSLDVSFEDDVSSEDDDSSDEDFRVNKNERCSDFNSGDSSFDGGRGADFKRKGKRIMTRNTCHRKRNEVCLNENNPMGRDKNHLRKGEKIGRDWPGKQRTIGFESKLKNVSNEAYVDEEYVQWVQHCERGNGRDNPGNSRHRQRKVGVESEPRKGYMSERFVDEEYVQWLHSESGNGLDNPGISRCTQRKAGVKSEPRKRYMPEELESRVSGSVVQKSVPVKRGSKKKRYRKKAKTPMDWCYEDFVRNEAESEGSSGSCRREGNKPMKKGKVTIKSTIQWINKHWK